MSKAQAVKHGRAVSSTAGFIFRLFDSTAAQPGISGHSAAVLHEAAALV